jgi:ABC-2 type transport system permease protein
VFAVVVGTIVNAFGKEYPTAAARALLVKTVGSSGGEQALFGLAHHLDTVAGYTAYHAIGVLGIIGAVWGLLTATRMLRGEEEAGRWELLLAGPTSRRRAAASAMAGLGVALLTLWVVTAAAFVGFGQNPDARFSVGASLFAAVAVVAAAAMFLAVGALCSQLAATRSRAAGLAAGVLGVAYLIRFVAYTDPRLQWLHWASPLGWVDELRPLTDNRPLVLVLIVGATAALVVLTILLAGKRDLGASVLPARDTGVSHTRLLNGPLGLAYRLGRGTALAWIAGFAVGGFVLGLSTKTMEEVWANQQAGVISNLGGAAGGTAYLGLVFLVFALVLAIAAAGQVGATREEEAEGYLDHLLARPVARLPWLAGRFAVSSATLLGAGVGAGLFAWVGAASFGANLSLLALLAAGVNLVPASIFVLGLGTLVQGLAPRFASTAAYGLVVWSLLVQIVGASLGASGWLLDLSVFHYVTRAPAVAVDWNSAAVLIAAGITGAAIGALAFARRDLKGA